MNKKIQRLAAAATLALSAFAAQATSVVVDVGGAHSIGLPGEDGNVVWLIDVDANAVLTSLDWTVTLNAFAPSSLSEMQVSFGGTSGPAFTLAPDAADGFSGAGSYSGHLDLTGLGAAVGADGKLRIEFSEAFKDAAAGVSEGQWVSGQLTFGVSAVPEPTGAALLLLGLGVVATARRVRRN